MDPGGRFAGMTDIPILAARRSRVILKRNALWREDLGSGRPILSAHSDSNRNRKMVSRISQWTVGNGNGNDGSVTYLSAVSYTAGFV